jgi:hypothetical protein
VARSRKRAEGLSWDAVVAHGLTLVGVEVGTAYGNPALRVGGSFTCRVRDDGVTLAIRCDPDERPLLVATHEACYVTPHYEAWPMVLVDLPTADPKLVCELVEDVWIEKAPKKAVAAFLAAPGD